jgi:DNA modification methylase
MDASNAPGSQLEFGELSGSGSPKRGDRPKQREPRRAPAARQVLPEGAPYAIYERDAVEWLCGLPDESVDLVVTDPPYESLEKHRAIGTTTRLKHSKASSNDWFRIFPNARFPELFREVYRVLSRDRHFYLFSDAETMFVVKPIAEAAGFKFWKPLVWDKCLGPETPVRTDRGVLRADAVAAGDSVFTPDGRTTTVLAVRQTTAPAVRLALSTGATLLASCEHRFLLADGTQAEASSLRSGAALASGATASSSITAALSMDALLDDEERVLEMPDPHACLFCGKQFDSVRGAAAHQARFCEAARSKASMAEAVGVAPKRLRRWMSEGRIPAAWAAKLGLSELSTGRSQLRLQNDLARWYPPSITLDYGWGKLIGLFAAEGWRSDQNVTFALHREEKHLQNHILRQARSLGLGGTKTERPENGVTVNVSSKIFSALMGHFIGGDNAITKHLRPSVFDAPLEFQRGVFDGIIEGDGHWSHDEHRETVNLASLDLASFVLRFARHIGWEATMRRRENEHAGFFRVRFDPAKKVEPIRVISVEDAGSVDLVDIAIDDVEQLYQLHDGVITHNCKIGMGYHYRARHEFILFFEKGKRRLADLSIPDIIAHPRVHAGYPTEKPAAVSEVLIRQSTVAGEIVADPFVGSGSAGVAAVALGRRFIGTDIAPGAVTLATDRIRAALP